jgi:benzylsuccinate CoA-transferase BbsF subunit
VRVADFTWVAAGALTTRLLADYGAEVVRVESLLRPDPLRLTGPFPPARKSLNASGFFNNLNAGKRGVTLNLGAPAALAAARDLIRLSDVVVENFRPGTMARWRLGYGDLSALRPDLIVASLSMQGAEGPYAGAAGFGSLIQALAGLNAITGFPDAPPSGPGIHYVDTSVNPLHALTAILAALHHRDHTGEGQWIDLSQLESTIAALGPTLLAEQLAGLPAGPLGNAHPAIAPHGIYPCRDGDDGAAWIALACPDLASWQALVSLLDRPELAAEARLRTALGRRRAAAELDAAVTAWTATRTRAAALATLANTGVPAAPVQDARDLAADPYFTDYYIRLDHPETGPARHDGLVARLSRTPGAIARPAPLLGQDTDWLLGDLLGRSVAEVTTAEESGALL